MNARLSPAYDLVATIAWLPNDALGLNFAGSKRFEDVSERSFRAFSKRLHQEEELVVTAAIETTRRTLAAVRESFEHGDPLTRQFAMKVLDHAKRVPLSSGR